VATTPPAGSSELEGGLKVGTTPGVTAPMPVPVVFGAGAPANGGGAAGAGAAGRELPAGFAAVHANIALEINSSPTRIPKVYHWPELG
jgi:hypothetical protein